MYLLWNRFKYVLSPQFDIYREISRVARGKVADVGFGTGFGTHLLNTKATEVYGYEIDEDAIQFATAVFPFKNLYFEYGNIIDGIDRFFDYVIMIDVLEHIKNPHKALMNVKKMLTQNGAFPTLGTFIMSTPNRLSRYRKSENHYREYAPKELEGILKRVFTNVSLHNYRLEPLASPYENPILAVCRNR